LAKKYLTDLIFVYLDITPEKLVELLRLYRHKVLSFDKEAGELVEKELEGVKRN
jgi:hypothetical protein